MTSPAIAESTSQPRPANKPAKNEKKMKLGGNMVIDDGD